MAVGCMLVGFKVKQGQTIDINETALRHITKGFGQLNSEGCYSEYAQGHLQIQTITTK